MRKLVQGNEAVFHGAVASGASYYAGYPISPSTEILNIADNDEFDFGSFLIAIGTSVLLLWLYLRYFAERDRRAVT